LLSICSLLIIDLLLISRQAEFLLIDFFLMAEAIGIVATLADSFYSLGKQIVILE
jgi:hypothetical protein